MRITYASHHGKKTAEFGQTLLSQTLLLPLGPEILHLTQFHSCALPAGFPSAIFIKAPAHPTSSRMTSYRLQNKSPHCSDLGLLPRLSIKFRIDFKGTTSMYRLKMTLFPFSHHSWLPALSSYTPAPGSKSRNRNLLHAPVATISLKLFKVFKVPSKR